MKYKIAVLPGDGIGPEVMAEALKVLSSVGDRFDHDFQCTEGLIGGSAYDKTGTSLPTDTLNLCRNSDAILLSAVGGPKWDNLPKGADPARGALLPLRKEFELYANLRPAKLFKSLAPFCPLKPEVIEKGIDILIVRELTGGIYFGEPRGRQALPEGSIRAYDTMEYRADEIERIAHVAFRAAQKRNNQLTSVDKANVLQTSILWREILTKTHKKYPNVNLNHLYIDIASMHLIKNPHRFDVVVTSNMFGDILSDLAAVLAGSMGMLPSASLGDKPPALYEPVHGSAPDIAGKAIANPIAQILSASMMLRYSFGLKSEADTIETAVEKTLEANYRTADIALPHQTPVSTQAMGNEIVRFIHAT